MKFVSILPVDSYVVINKSLLNDSDRKILTMLYQPIVGCMAINLYFSLWSDLNKTEVMSNEYTHHHLMANMKLNLDEIVGARKKLEALGLIRTHYKVGNINNYVYEIFSPLTVLEFFSNPILSFSLYSSIGKKEYDDLVNYFKMPKINFNGFENISIRFSDLFTVSSKNIEDVTERDIKKKEKLDILVDDFVDFNFIEQSISKIFNGNVLNQKLKSLINKLAYLYNFDNITISNIIMNSINEKGIISEIELKKNCKNYYLFENKGNTPTLVYKSKSSDKGIVNDKGLREKLISCFENVTPYDFLKSKYKGAKPTSKDITLLEGLLVDQILNPGVINVLMDYVLRVNDKKLNKGFVESIASQWKMLGIDSVESAMKQAEKEYKKHKKYKESKETNKKTEKLPHWYGKEIKKESMTKEEEEELKNMLEEFA